MDIITSNIINNLIILIYYLKNQNNFNDFVDIFILDGIEISYYRENINNLINNYNDNLIKNIKIFFNEYNPLLKMSRYDYLKDVSNKNLYFDRFQLYDIYEEKINNFKHNWIELIQFKYYIILNTDNIENNLIEYIDKLNYNNLIFKEKLFKFDIIQQKKY